jgi:hypothetical protein
VNDYARPFEWGTPDPYPIEAVVKEHLEKKAVAINRACIFALEAHGGKGTVRVDNYRDFGYRIRLDVGPWEIREYEHAHDTHPFQPTCPNCQSRGENEDETDAGRG